MTPALRQSSRSTVRVLGFSADAHPDTVAAATTTATTMILFESLIYGEVDFHSFARVLRKINPKPGCVFYDLGSGTAKAVFVARFMHDFSAYVICHEKISHLSCARQ